MILFALLLGIAITTLGTPGFDGRLLLALAPLREGYGANFWLAMTFLGDAEVRIAVGLAFVAWLCFVGRARLAALLLGVVALETLANGALKRLFARARPDLLPQLDSVSSFAFPSGHSAHPAALYLLIGLIVATMLSGRVAKAAAIGAALALVGLIGVSRIILGVHWPTDVAGGWAFGTGCALLGWAVARTGEPSPPDPPRQAPSACPPAASSHG